MFLVNKTSDALDSNFIGITTLHVSGSLFAHHQEYLAVHRRWYILCSFDDRFLPGARWNSGVPSWSWQKTVIKTQDVHPATGSKWSSKLHKMYQCRCTAPNSSWRMQRLPETCSRNTNKFEIQRVCWFYSKGIYHNAQSYNSKMLKYAPVTEAFQQAPEDEYITERDASLEGVCNWSDVAYRTHTGCHQSGLRTLRFGLFHGSRTLKNETCGKYSKNEQSDKFLRIFKDNLLEIHTLKLWFYSMDKMSVYCTYQLVLDIYMHQERCQL